LESLPNRKWLTCTEALDYLGSQLEVSNRDAAILLRDAFLEGRIRTRVDTEIDHYKFWRHATILPPFASNRFGPPLVRFDVSAEDLVGVWPTIVKKQPNELPESEWLPAKEAIYWVSRRLGASAVAASELINDRLSSGVIKSRERRWIEGSGPVDDSREPRPVDHTRWITGALRPDGMITSRGINAGIPLGSSTFPLIEVHFADLKSAWPTVVPDTTECGSMAGRGPHQRALPSRNDELRATLRTELGREGGTKSGEARKANRRWTAHAEELAIPRYERDENASNDIIAGEISGSWKLADVHCPGVRTLSKFVSELRAAGKLPKRTGSVRKRAGS
jgi:hypothetical protein